MAACIRSQLSKLLFIPKNATATVIVRGSRYDQTFVKNTKDYDEIHTPLHEHDERQFKKIKAALTDDSTFADVHPDIQYFINRLVKEGKKEVARLVVRKTFENIKRTQLEKYHKSPPEDKDKIELDPLTIFKTAFENSQPDLHTVKVMKSGTVYKVPVPCLPSTRRFLAMKWIIQSGKERDLKKSKIYDKMAADLIDAFHHEGHIIAKKQELYRICEMNKMYSNLIYKR